jgi:hypothetical protein
VALDLKAEGTKLQKSQGDLQKVHSCNSIAAIAAFAAFHPRMEIWSLWSPFCDERPGPYLIHPVEFVRTTDQKMTCLRSYNPTRVACVMDRSLFWADLGGKIQLECHGDHGDLMVIP